MLRVCFLFLLTKLVTCNIFLEFAYIFKIYLDFGKKLRDCCEESYFFIY